MSSALIAALRNLVRNRLYAAINIAGLAIGFSGAFLIALFVLDELSYDRFIPGHENAYLVSSSAVLPNGEQREYRVSSPTLAAWLKLKFPQVEAVARTAGANTVVRRGNIEGQENITTVDPDFFIVLPVPTVAGDLKNALRRPDGIVITQSIARKYFGREYPIGGTLTFGGGDEMTVMAVTQDMRSNTHLQPTSIFVSNSATISPLRALDISRGKTARIEPFIATTYVRLTPGTSFDPQSARPECAKAGACSETFALIPVADVHLHHFTSSAENTRSPRTTIRVLCALGVLILLIAAINFVNLTTARAARRAVEIGVRKTSGATRIRLIGQFIGESLLYSSLGAVMALGIVELSLPAVNAFLDRTIEFDYWRDPQLGGTILALVILAGVLAGAYPAFVMSAFRPAAIFNTSLAGSSGAGLVRRMLVIAQFSVLIVLVLMTGVIYEQIHFAMHEGMRVDKNQVLLISVGDSECLGAFRKELARLPGVLKTACSMNAPLGNGISLDVDIAGGSRVPLRQSIVDFEYFTLYGIRPIAGRLFSVAYATDAAPTDRESRRQPPLVINATASRDLGFASPAAAVGRSIHFPRFMTMDGRLMPGPAQIIGVVPDFPLGSIRRAVEPTAFFIDPVISRNLNVKLNGRDIPETLLAIERLWKDTGHSGAPRSMFFDERLRQLYRDVRRQIQVITAAAGVALILACLGLFGLASFIAEQRTREIGIRKAMGADRPAIIRLLLWSFSSPILWANLIAWPAGYYLVNRWLQGFAYRIELQPWMFLAASGAALGIALLTVAAHTIHISRARPVEALRHE